MMMPITDIGKSWRAGIALSMLGDVILFAVTAFVKVM